MLARLCAAALAVLAQTTPLQAPPADPPPATDPSLAAPAFDRRPDGRVTVQVEINGKGPFPFIVDTGANRTAISRALLEPLGLAITGEDEVHGLAGSEMRPIVRVESLRSGALQLQGGMFPVVEQATLGGASGLLAASDLLAQGVELDFLRSRFRVVPSRRRASLSGRVVLRAELRFGSLLSVPCQIGAVRDAACIIDTGSAYSFVTPALADRLLLRGEASVVARDITMFGVTAGGMQGDIVRIQRVVLGSSEVLDGTVFASDAHVFHLWGLDDKPALVLGMNVLRAYGRVRIDYPARLVSLGTESCQGPPRICQTR